MNNHETQTLPTDEKIIKERLSEISKEKSGERKSILLNVLRAVERVGAPVAVTAVSLFGVEKYYEWAGGWSVLTKSFDETYGKLTPIQSLVGYGGGLGSVFGAVLSYYGIQYAKDQKHEISYHLHHIKRLNEETSELKENLEAIKRPKEKNVGIRLAKQ
jgi:hypothetical protein